VRAVPILAALVALSTIVRSLAGLAVPSPWIAGDEMIYAELGRSLWESGSLDILGRDAPFYSLVHPALIGLPLALSTDFGYDVARVVQALAMSLTAVPVFFWGRRLMSERWALVAAALTLTLPAFAYAGLLMTETVFLPAMTLVAWMAAESVARPSRRSHAFLLGAFVLALLTRLQALVFVPAFLLALVLLALVERSTEPFRRSWPAAAGLVGLGAFWLVLGGFGAYEPAGETSYSFGGALKFIVYHTGDVLLLVGLAPACAVVLLALEAARRAPDASTNVSLRELRAYLAVTIALAAGVVAEVGIFASRYVGRLAERDLLAVAPLLFLGLCAWLDRGAPRTRLRASIVALAAAALVVLLPYGRLVHKGAIQDAFMLLPLYDLGSHDLVVGVAVAVVVLLFVLYPRALPIVLAAAFLVVSVEASRFVENEATTLRTSFFADNPSWLDSAADGAITYIYDGEPHWNAVWAHVFWNRRIRDVIDLPGERVPGPLPQQAAPIGPDGSLPGSTPYVVGSTAFTFFGEPVAQIQQNGLVQRGLVLWRVQPPLRLSTALTGVQGSGDIYGPARLTAYDCTLGTFELTLIAKGAPVDVRIGTHGGGAERTLAPGEIWRPSLPATPLDGTCTVEVGASGLIGSTRFEFVRG
jgi:Dolichyl-phosphate-mannose-protein mannosyltransferase